MKQTKDKAMKRDIFRKHFQDLGYLVISGTILFLSSGNTQWTWAGLFLLIFVAYTLIHALILPPELLAERGRAKSDVKDWDKMLMRYAAIPALAILLIAGLDNRWMWTKDMHLWLPLLGVALHILGDIIVTRSMLSNHYFSTMVRIQKDRQHSVAQTGPYSVIRHPGYAGILLNTLSTPLILGSWWAFIPAVILAVLFIIRTHWEDQTLEQELKGYVKYRKKVRHKILPGVW